MKKLILLLSITTLLNCSTDNECECIKETYKWHQYASYGQIIAEKVILNVEVVPCQDEQTQTNNGDGTYYNIYCD